MNKIVKKISTCFPRNVQLELNKLREELQSLQYEKSLLSEENRKLKRKIEEDSSKNKVLYEKMMELCDIEDSFNEQMNELENVKLQSKEQKELLDSITPGIKEMVISVIEIEIKAGISGRELYEKFSDADDGDWYPCPCLVRACTKLLGNAPIHQLYPEEDNLGIFECMDPYQEMEWRENKAFGEIINSRFCGMYEFCDYEIDKESQEYKEYRKKLYEEAIRNLAQYAPAQMFGMDPAFFICNKKEKEK